MVNKRHETQPDLPEVEKLEHLLGFKVSGIEARRLEALKLKLDRPQKGDLARSCFRIGLEIAEQWAKKKGVKP